MLSDRANAICILEILREYSDAEHILPMRTILHKMKSLYGTDIDRRTVYSAISLLKDNLGYEISTYEENKQGYYLQERILEVSEVRLLMEAVYACDGIPRRQSELLIEKLQKLLSVHQRKQYMNLRIIRRERRTPNKSVFFNIDLLDEAISSKVQVEFTYLKYNLEKKLVPKRSVRYLVNPYALVFANGNYYLICNYDAYDNISYYRVDKICDVRILERQPVKPLAADFDLTKFTQKHIYMFSPYSESVKIRCHNVILDDVIEKFGNEILLLPDGEEYFTAVLRNTPGGIQFWLLQYLQYCEVLEPLYLREEIIEFISKNKYSVR